MSRTALYRHFDAEGRLLYVGITDHLGERDKQHAATSVWHHAVIRSDVQWCLSREHAAELERVAIRHEGPLYNLAHRPAQPRQAAPMTILEFAEAVGRQKVAATVGVLPTAVSNAVVRGWFPSSWFLVCKDLAEQAGINCPPALFKMREAGEA